MATSGIMEGLVDVICWHCGHSQELYRSHNTPIPVCPKCGWGCNGDAPLTSGEYMRAMGINTQREEK